jgi:hypothetical protein
MKLSFIETGQILKILVITYMHKHMCMHAHIQIPYMLINIYILTQ